MTRTADTNRGVVLVKLRGGRPSAWALLGGLMILGTIAWYTLAPKRTAVRL